MRNFILAVLALLLNAVAGSAQSVGVAILTHGDEVKSFYGNSALKQAAEVAQDGDVISLSPGFFEEAFIKNSNLTIVGSGMVDDEYQTRVYALNFNKCEVPKNNRIQINLSNINLNIFYGNNYSFEAKLVKFSGRFDGANGNGSENKSTVEISNSTIVYIPERNVEIQAYNTVFYPFARYGDNLYSFYSNCIFLNPPRNCSVENSIFVCGGEYERLSGDVRATNCKSLSTRGDFFGIESQDCERFPYDYDAFVKDSFYKLKPELETKWVDKDGSQIGLYGGFEPFNPTPSNPRITKCDVSSRTTADGKLAIDLEVSIPE